MTIHTIGDSHAAFCFRGTKLEEEQSESIIFFKEGEIFQVPISIHHLGPKTMHSFGLNGLNESEFSNVKEEEYVVFCFGEIDVRCHVDKQVKIEKRSLDEVIELLVMNYISQIKKIEEKHKVIPIIFGVTPPVTSLTVDGHPSIGSLQERVSYTKALNKALCSHAKKVGFGYFDVFDIYSNKNGSLNMELSDKFMHIGEEFNLPVKEKLCNLIWEISEKRKSN